MNNPGYARRAMSRLSGAQSSATTLVDAHDPGEIRTQFVMSTNGLILVAARNDSLNLPGESNPRPATLTPSTITVGALDGNYDAAGFSNYGAPVDVWAPVLRDRRLRLAQHVHAHLITRSNTHDLLPCGPCGTGGVARAPDGATLAFCRGCDDGNRPTV